MLTGATFVIVADASAARFLQRDGPGEVLIELSDLSMIAEERPPEADRAAPAVDPEVSAPQAVERRMNAREALASGFLIEVAARAMVQVEKEQPACIAVCAPAATLGILRRLVRNGGDRVLISAPKDLMKETVLQIDQRLLDLGV